jgi:hypothetical protein
LRRGSCAKPQLQSENQRREGVAVMMVSFPVVGASAAIGTPAFSCAFFRRHYPAYQRLKRPICDAVATKGGPFIRSYCIAEKKD